MAIPKNLAPKQTVAYRRWIGTGKGRAQALKLAKTPKASRQP